MRGAARCSTDGRGARDSCSPLSVHSQLLCPSTQSLPRSLVQLPRLSFPPSLLHSQERSAVGRSPAPLPTGGGDGLFSVFSCQGTTQCPSFVPSVTDQGIFFSQVQTLVCCQVRFQLQLLLSGLSAFMRKVASSSEWARKEGALGLGLSDNNAASEHNADV